MKLPSVNVRGHSSGLVRRALWCAAAATILLAVFAGRLFHSTMAQTGLGAALGGAASNLFDRVRRGSVVDFIDLKWWPVFNVADIGITAGVIAALWFR